MSLPVEPERIEALHERILSWFEDHRRDLPWREEGPEDPYGVLVREIMLQQTRMSTALPYYERWMERWPTVQALARASEEEVLEAWQGLGYYNRARWLLRTARRIVDEHGGTVPQRLEELEELPGVGPYTAAAVASMAYGVPAPAVDGNMARVVARIEGLKADVTSDKVKDELRTRLTPLFDRGRPGRLNEALMELGSLVCTPQDPSCEVCTAAEVCTARAEDRTDAIPERRETGPLETRPVLALLVRDDQGRILVRKRGLDGVLGGLWGLPMAEREDGEGLPKAAGRVLRDESPSSAPQPGPVAQVEHTFSHKRWKVRVHQLEPQAPVEPGEDERFVALDQLDELPSSTLDDRVFEAIA